MARILHIDSSGPVGIVMLAENGKPLHHKTSEGERDHAEKFNGLVADVLTDAGVELKYMNAIAVCNGPGSYTGLRIGLATAKGYCYVLDKPLVLHNRLQLMLRELAMQSIDNEADMLAILPARAGEYYIAAKGTYSSQPRHITTDELLQNYSNNSSLYIIGEVHADLEGLTTRRIVSHQLLNMSVWAAAAYESFLRNDFPTLHIPNPNT